MMKFYFLFVLNLIIFSCSGQRYSSIIPDSLIHSVVKKIEPDNLDGEMLRWDLSEAYISDSLFNEIDSLRRTKGWNAFEIRMKSDIPRLVKYLKKEDFAFIKLQLESSVKTTWNTDSLTVKNYVKSLESVEKYQKFSVPLFSKNKEFLLLKVYFHCGNLCGYTCINLYRISESSIEEIGCMYKRLH